MMGPSSTRVAYNDGCADVHVERASNTIQIVGRCVHGNPHVEVCGNNTQASYDIGAQKSKKGTLVSQAWARKLSDLLGLEPEQNKEELLRLGRKYGIVTANTSMELLHLFIAKRCLTRTLRQKRKRRFPKKKLEKIIWMISRDCGRSESIGGTKSMCILLPKNRSLVWEERPDHNPVRSPICHHHRCLLRE